MSEKVQMMLLGSVITFFTTLVLFWIKELIGRKWKKGSLKKCVVKEIEYNQQHFLANLKLTLEKYISHIAAENGNIHDYIDYGGYSRTFLDKYFVEGYLYEENKIEIGTIAKINGMLSHMTAQKGMYLNEIVHKWKIESAEISKQSIHSFFELEKKQIERYIKFNDDLLKRLQG